MGMTIAEKILARNAGLKKVGPGDVVTVEVQTVILIDNNFQQNVRVDILKMRDPGRVIVVFDHRVPAANQQSAAAHVAGRELVKKFGIKRFHDVGPNQGIAHQLIADHGYALPGTVLLCSDSHTCSAGVFNCVARGVGAPDVVYAAIKGETWFRVGETIRYELEGSLAPAVTMKDTFFHIASRYGEHSTMNVELGGPGMANLSIDARKTLTTMAAELSAEFATFEPDDVMLEWVRARNPAPFEAVFPDRDAHYKEVRKLDMSVLEPQVAFPDSIINNTRPVADAAGTVIDQAFVGSCANGTLEDLALVAKVLEGRQVSPKVRFLVTPASQNVYREALRTGIIAKISDAGALVTPSTCGACGGGHMGVVGPNETCITATTRNFKGRMGDPTARIFMGSPATIAASAITGVITDPREFIN